MQKQDLLTKNKTFCMMPFIHVYLNPNGDALPCCVGDFTKPLDNIDGKSLKELWNSDGYKTIRLKMISGEETPHCTTCYKNDELSPNTSFRSWVNKKFEHYIDIVDYMNSDGSMAVMSLKYFDLRFSNICNFKCRSCGSLFSSSWATEDKKFTGNKQISISIADKKPDLMDEFKPHLLGIDTFYFAGGEPVITPEHYFILEHLIENNRTNVELRYNSNCSVLKYKDKNLIELWKHFPNIYFGASLDSWGKRAEYIRHGTNWSDVISNLQQIKRETPHIILDFNCVVSVMNIHTLTDFLDVMHNEELIDVQKSTPNLTILRTPAELGISILSYEEKEKIKIKIKKWIFDNKPSDSLKIRLNNILDFLNVDDSNLSRDFKSYTMKIDKRRDESFVDTFPELRDWYDSI